MKITKIKKLRDEYTATCPNCNKTFTSLSKKQLEWNMRVHHASCKKKQQNKEEIK